MRTVRVRIGAEDGVFNTVDRVLVDNDQFEREMVMEMDWHSDGSAIILYRIRGDDPDELEAVLSAADGIVHAEVLGESEGDSHFVFVKLEPESPMSDMLSMLDRSTVLIDRPIIITDEGAELRIAGTEAALRTAMTDLPEDIDFVIEHASDTPPTDESLRSYLTERQREAVRVAIDLGYYETPREATYEDIAYELDCAPSTANELLRRAESSLVTAVFGQ